MLKLPVNDYRVTQTRLMRSLKEGDEEVESKMFLRKDGNNFEGILRGHLRWSQIRFEEFQFLISFHGLIYLQIFEQV